MARKGKLAPNAKLKPFLENGTSPRCQFVKFPKEGKKYGEQCEKACIKGRPRCKYHGGKAGRPIETGEHSKYNPMPKGILAKFEKAINDPKLLDLEKDIALFDAQIWQICEEASKQENFDVTQMKKLIALEKQKRQSIKTQTEMKLAAGSYLDAGQVLLIINRIFNSIIKNVADETARRRIGADLREIVGSKTIDNVTQKVIG